MDQVPPKLTIVEIPIIETYELVDWPDGCAEVPTYFQLCSTLEIVEMYKNKPEHFKPALAATVEKWLKTNSVVKFEKAIETAEQVQTMLDSYQEDFLEANRLFPLKRPRYSH